MYFRTWIGLDWTGLDWLGLLITVIVIVSACVLRMELGMIRSLWGRLGAALGGGGGKWNGLLMGMGVMLCLLSFGSVGVNWGWMGTVDGDCGGGK